MIFDAVRDSCAIAEKTGKRGLFSAAKPATFPNLDCYTFQTFASKSDENPHRLLLPLQEN
jgi:hypothetical protein